MTRPLYPREIPGTHCTGGWLGPRAGLDVCENLVHTGIRSPDRPARSESLYRLSYPGPPSKYNYIYILTYRMFHNVHDCTQVLQNITIYIYINLSHALQRTLFYQSASKYNYIYINLSHELLRTRLYPGASKYSYIYINLSHVFQRTRLYTGASKYNYIYIY
jgi:hypothetical protein